MNWMDIQQMSEEELELNVFNDVGFFRAKEFSKVIRQSGARVVYDFGCGLCLLKRFVGGLKYIGFDREKHTPEVQVVDLAINFPTIPEEGREERIAVASGVLEYLPYSLILVQWILRHFDRFIFTYGIVKDRHEAATRYRHTVVLSPDFERGVAAICEARGFKLEMRLMEYVNPFPVLDLPVPVMEKKPEPEPPAPPPTLELYRSIVQPPTKPSRSWKHMEAPYVVCVRLQRPTPPPISKKKSPAKPKNDKVLFVPTVQQNFYTITREGSK